MTRRAKGWQVVAAIFGLVNGAGAGFAAAQSEALHAGAHVALGLLGVYVVWWLTARAGRQDVPALSRADERLEQLQQSVDAIAVEVERIGEANRFNVKLQSERTELER